MQSLVLCVVYAVFLVFGAVIFMNLEYEVLEDVIPNEKWHQLKEIALSEDPPEDEDNFSLLLAWLEDECTVLPDNASIILSTPGNQSQIIQEVEDLCEEVRDQVNSTVDYTLSFIDALYFSMTVSTTIGYGHISPTVPLGKIVCMLYSCIGIPFTGILLAWTSDFFGERLFALFKAKLSAEKQNSKKFIALGTTVYIGIGLVVFIFIPSVVFSYLEDWTYLTSVYYAFITLTTIGFGDYVTGGGVEGAWHYVYQILVIVWILVGLGYWIMIANFITRALQSEKLQNSLLKRAEDVKKMMGMNTDPRFLTQHSKATVNFMLQLSNMLVTPDGGGFNNPGMTNGLANGNGPQSSSSPPAAAKPVGIPGIAALFANQRGARSPTMNLFSPGMFGVKPAEEVPKSPESTRTVEEVVEMDTDSVSPDSDSDKNSRNTSFKSNNDVTTVTVHPSPTSEGGGYINTVFEPDT